MSKRRPEHQLTKDNFDIEEPEDDGDDRQVKSEKASAEVLKNRVFLKAKRRNAETASSDSSSFSNATGGSLFGGFKGFNSLGNSETSKLFGSFSTSATSSTAPFTFKMTDVKDSKPEVKTAPTKSPSREETPAGDEKDENPPTKMNSKLSENLRKLNQSFFDHIKKYVSNTNDIYDFTLVCEEYINKCKKFREMFEKEGEEVKTNGEKEKSGPNPTPDFGFKFVPEPKTDLVKNTASSLFSFPTTTFPMSTSFKLPFAVSGNVAKGDNSDAAEAENQDQEDQPPPKVSVEHEEDDSVYNKKCKLYYKKEETFVEKGVGFLYIKLDKNDNSKPAQLLVRADNNIGTILLNIALIESLPIIKAEKGKGVLITCVPNPPLGVGKMKDSEEEKKSVTFLIRVKTTDCDELYENLIKYQKGSAK